jgi:hypothetical protein
MCSLVIKRDAKCGTLKALMLIAVTLLKSVKVVCKNNDVTWEIMWNEMDKTAERRNSEKNKLNC